VGGAAYALVGRRGGIGRRLGGPGAAAAATSDSAASAAAKSRQLNILHLALACTSQVWMALLW